MFKGITLYIQLTKQQPHNHITARLWANVSFPSGPVNLMNVIFHSTHTQHSMTHTRAELTLLINIIKVPSPHIDINRTHRQFTLPPHINILYPLPSRSRQTELVNRAVFSQDTQVSVPSLVTFLNLVNSWFVLKFMVLILMRCINCVLSWQECWTEMVEDSGAESSHVCDSAQRLNEDF